jgi:hypothetical protein
MQRALTSTLRPSSMFGVATRLALLLSVAATLAVVTLDPIAEVSRNVVVAVVAAVGFVASWIMTGRARSVPVARHRVAVVPIHQRVS